jgi:hypothetical protein
MKTTLPGERGNTSLEKAMWEPVMFHAVHDKYSWLNDNKPGNVFLGRKKPDIILTDENNEVVVALGYDMKTMIAPIIPLNARKNMNITIVENELPAKELFNNVKTGKPYSLLIIWRLQIHNAEGGVKFDLGAAGRRRILRCG